MRVPILRQGQCLIATVQDALSDSDLRDLQRAHSLAYIFISHDLAVVRALSDEIMVMKSGKVVERGTAEEIFDRPREEYTRDLIAAAFLTERDKAEAVTQPLAS